MAKTVLGLSAFYHDSAACLLVDGQIVAAAQEERFSRKKHDAEFPKLAAAYCLSAGGIDAKALDHVAFYDKPLLKFERLFETYLEYAPDGFASFLKAMPLWLTNRLFLEEKIREELGTEAPILFGDHHESHAASAFFPSPFEEAAILTMDGVGEWATSSVGLGKGNGLTLLAELKFPHSIGLLYSAFTYYCGFKVNSGEYKLMGLAPYGEPKYVREIRETLVHVCDDGSIRLNMEYFDFPSRLRMTGKGFERLFGGPAREPESKLTQREMDLARSIQEVTEEIVLKMAAHVRKTTGARYLCLAGGVALNCVANGRLLRERTFDDLWIQPAAGDAGGAVGAALAVWHRYLGMPRESAERRGTWGPRSSSALPPYEDGMSGAFLGPSFPSKEIAAWLESRRYPFRTVSRRGAARDGGGPPVGREGRRPPAGTDGVRPARPRRTEHPGRSPLAPDAVRHEPEDQVPRVVPPLRAVGDARGGREVVRRRRRLALHAPRRRRGGAAPAGDDRRRTGAVGDREAERAALGDPRGHARRLLGPSPDGPARGATRSTTRSWRRSSERPAALSS